MLSTLATLIFSTVPLSASASKAEEPVGFRDDVAPILVSRCLGCHNDEKAQGGLNLTTFALLKQGGDIEGEFIIEPGDPESSHLIAVLQADAPSRMPLDQEPLNDEQIRILERWIEQGAEFDGPSETETKLASLVDPLANLPVVEVKGPVAAPLSASAFSPDGKLLAAALGSRILLFDADNAGEPVATLQGHAGQVNALGFSPDGSTLFASGGRPGLFGALSAWDLQSRKRRFDLRGHTDAILDADLSPDGKILATCSYDRLIKLWDVETGDEIRTLQEHTDAVYAVAFSPDGKWLAPSSGDRTAKLWEVASGRRLVSLADATAELYAIAFGPGGETVLAGGVDRSIWQWRVSGSSGRLVRSTIAHDGPILRLVLAPEGDQLYSTGEDRAIKRWSLPALRPVLAWPAQPDWPLTLALDPDGSRLAVGRYDGSLALLSTTDPEQASTIALLEAPRADDDPARESKAEDPKPELVRKATLGPPAPKGAPRGETLKVHLSGNGIGQANAVVFDHPSLVASILADDKPDPNRLQIELTIAEDAPLGRQRFWVQTPLGVPDPQGFAVYEAPESVEVEPNNRPEEATAIPLPSTLAGIIDKPGDVDHFRFEAEPGQELVLEDLGSSLGSALDPILELTEASGLVVARGASSLTYRVPESGPLSLRIADRQFGGSGNHFYRLQAGLLPRLESGFPLGIERGTSAELTVEGWNLEGGSTVTIEAPESARPGSILPVPPLTTAGPRVVVAEGLQEVEIEANDDPEEAQPISFPGGVSGRIDRPGDVDHYRFEARKGRPMVLEVFGQRLGSPIDPTIEILDTAGEPIPLAVLRPIAETAIAFRDHNSSQPNIRLTKWDELAMDDFLLVGRELMRLFALPRNPDDDAIFWSSGGQRLSYLGTTSEQHPQSQAIYKVEIHPPGTTFPKGGAEPIILYHRNDDGSGIGNDARLPFDPPADGPYLVRVEDARGLGGSAFGYHLVIREPRPDFELSVSPENPSVPRGGVAILTARVRRLDGFEAALDVRVEGLPKGFSATSARIEPGHFSADLLLSADESTWPFTPPGWRVIAEEVLDDAEASSQSPIRHEFHPGGSSAGWISLTPAADLKVSASAERVEILPGEEAELTLSVERSAAFSGRVPIDVRNLPHGVRVLNIGLNGVLITEKESQRTITLYAEPWVEPMERPFYAVGRVEATGIESSSPPIRLEVRPAEAGARLGVGPVPIR